jgi:hypothetical protein
MANWFYYDNNTAEKRGPFNPQELKNLAANGTISLETVIESDNGKTTKIKDIPELKKIIEERIQNTAAPPQMPLPPFPTPPTSDSGFQNRNFGNSDSGFQNRNFGNFDTEAIKQELHRSSVSFFGWIFDFGFKHSYVMKVIRLLISISYVISIIFIVLCGVVNCFFIFFGVMDGLRHNQASAFLLFLLIPLSILFTLLTLILARLWHEFVLYSIDWLVTIKKAADKYNAE